MKYLICNLKAHKTYQEMLEYREEVTNIRSDINLILAPSNIYLSLLKGTNISLCCQNIDKNENLELTGSTSMKQLESVGVKYVMIGHFERRKFFNEAETDIIEKIKIALNHNMKVIYCIGETKEEEERKVEYQVLERMIARVFNGVPKEQFKNIIIAYEPTYLIGQERPYNIVKISETIKFIKTLVNDYYHSKIDVVFGGSINIKNIDKLLNIPNLDGFIIGSSSLNPSNISEILDKMAS